MTPLPYNAAVTWRDETLDGVRVIRPESPPGFVVAFSGRGHAPADEQTPTPYLARRLARTIGLDGTPIRWAKQVHGITVATPREPVPAGGASCAGDCDALVTDRTGEALVVQTADCVPILLAAPRAVGGGARGLARDGEERRGCGGRSPRASRRGAVDDPRVARDPRSGPAATRSAARSRRSSRATSSARDAAAATASTCAPSTSPMLAAAGVPRDAIAVHPACTKCGGEGFSSWRRDGAKAGRMIALIARS